MTGHKLRLYREFRNYSQEYIAEKLGITQNAYSRIENNLTRITTERLHELARILDIPPRDLLSDKEPVILCDESSPGHYPHSGDAAWREWTESMRQLYSQVICGKDERITCLENEVHYLRKERERMIHLLEKLTIKDLASLE